MRILYIAPSPPNELERTRSLNIIRSLRQKGGQITLITLYNKEQEQYLNVAKKYVDKIIKIKYSKIIATIYAGISLILPVPLRTGYCFNWRLRRTLKKQKTPYDIVYIKRLRMAQYKKYVKSNKTYIDITDSLTKYNQRMYKTTEGIKKLLFYIEYLKYKRYELKICKENQNIIICSEEDKKYIENLSDKAKGNIQVIENVLEPIQWKNDKIKIKEKRTKNKISIFRYNGLST